LETVSIAELQQRLQLQQPPLQKILATFAVRTLLALLTNMVTSCVPATPDLSETVSTVERQLPRQLQLQQLRKIRATFAMPMPPAALTNTDK